MYVKISFVEQLWVVPQCASGVVIGLSKSPEILDVLPQGTVSNKCVNIVAIEADNDASDACPATYDYYLDCGNLNRNSINEAIKLFTASYENGQPGANLGENVKCDPNEESEQSLETLLETFRNANSIIAKLKAVINQVQLRSGTSSYRISTRLTNRDTPSSLFFQSPQVSSSGSDSKPADSFTSALIKNLI